MSGADLSPAIFQSPGAGSPLEEQEQSADWVDDAAFSVAIWLRVFPKTFM